MISRRTLLKYSLGLATGGAIGIGTYTWRIEPHWVQLVHRSLQIPSLPETLEGSTLVQLSDIHIGPKVSDRYLREAFRRVRSIDPDIVAITGDWVTYRGPWQFSQFRNLISEVPKGRLGTVAVLGNHDYGFGWKQSHVARQLSKLIRRRGIELLRNSSCDINGLHFIGMDDFWGPRFDPASALRHHSPEIPSIALCHNPDAVDQPVWDRFQGWILAGHTHGGQCKPPFLPPPRLPVVNRNYTEGEFRLSGNRRLYINRGLGHLMQVRFNVRPEITIFQLRGAVSHGMANLHSGSSPSGRTTHSSVLSGCDSFGVG